MPGAGMPYMRSADMAVATGGAAWALVMVGAGGPESWVIADPVLVDNAPGAAAGCRFARACKNGAGRGIELT